MAADDSGLGSYDGPIHPVADHRHPVTAPRGHLRRGAAAGGRACLDGSPAPSPDDPPARVSAQQDAHPREVQCLSRSPRNAALLPVRHRHTHHASRPTTDDGRNVEQAHLGIGRPEPGGTLVREGAEGAGPQLPQVAGGMVLSTSRRACGRCRCPDARGSDSRGTQGNGLGMAIVADTVTSHGGTVHLGGVSGPQRCRKDAATVLIRRPERA